MIVFAVFNDATYPAKLDKLFLSKLDAEQYAKETYSGKEYTVEELEVIH